MNPTSSTLKNATSRELRKTGRGGPPGGACVRRPHNLDWEGGDLGVGRVKKTLYNHQQTALKKSEVNAASRGPARSYRGGNPGGWDLQGSKAFQRKKLGGRKKNLQGKKKQKNIS